MPAARELRVAMAMLALGGGSALAQDVPAWDYIVSGSGIYTGHSTGVLNAAGNEALVFACSMSARGAIMFEVATRTPVFADGENDTVTVRANGQAYEIVAMMVDAEGTQMAMTWGSQAAVNQAAVAVFESDGLVTVEMGGHVHEFAGAGGSENFASMLGACGGRY